MACEERVSLPHKICGVFQKIEMSIIENAPFRKEIGRGHDELWFMQLHQQIRRIVNEASLDQETNVPVNRVYYIYCSFGASPPDFWVRKMSPTLLVPLVGS